MIEFKKLESTSKELFDLYLKNKYPNSEASFANMYIWRDFYRTRYAEVEGYLVVWNSPPGDDDFCYMPYGSGDLALCLAELKKHFESLGKKFIINSASHLEAEMIKELYPDAVVKENRDFFDYVYLTESLITLSGRKLRSKRNHINNFRDSYKYVYRPIAEADFDSCRELARRAILKTRSEDSDSFLFEMKSIDDAFDKFSFLGLCGGLIEIDGQVVAFTVGEKLTDDCALIHIEKADTDYDGIYAAINNEFAKNAWSDVMYINREEDMGIEGLRTAKLSYRPHHMVEKYICIL